MGLFSKKSETEEPSHSRAWIARYGAGSRKNALALAVVNRLVVLPLTATSSWGKEIEGAGLKIGRDVVEGVVAQDRSLARAVARDVALAFESFGGLADNQALATEAAGPLTSVGTDALTVARVIKARYEGGPNDNRDGAFYRTMFEDTSAAWHDRAVSIAAWAGIVVGRLQNAGHLGETPFFNAAAANVGQMEGVGWYPNPVNAGDTSGGDASLERWWDGQDWTDRLRMRDGRRWTPHTLTMFTAPNN